MRTAKEMREYRSLHPEYIARQRQKMQLYRESHRDSIREMQKQYHLVCSHPCPVCGIPTRGSTCRNCKQGEANPNWRGGRVPHDGYIYVRVSGKYIAEHRLVWESLCGSIPDDYIVHHLNGQMDDNRIDNLTLVSRAEHMFIHRKTIESARQL